MTDAPERIWADSRDDNWTDGRWTDANWGGDVWEYIREDAHTAALAVEREKALREAAVRVDAAAAEAGIVEQRALEMARNLILMMIEKDKRND